MSTKAEIVKEIFKPARKNFLRRKIIIKDFYETLSVDLADMQKYATENKNMKFILCVIDNFSKFAYVRPLKNKTGPEVAQAMEEILSLCPAKPKFIHSDQGGEFFNHHFKKIMDNRKIKHFHTYIHLKAAICERFIRTLKTNLWQRFALQGTYNSRP